MVSVINRIFKSCIVGSFWIVSSFGISVVGTGTVLAQQSSYGNQDVISDILVQGNQRIEVETVKSYIFVRKGDLYDEKQVDRSLKSLFNTGLFSDVKIGRSGQTLVIEVAENPIINRIVFEGNKYKKDDKLYEEIQLRPRIVFSRSKVRADVSRILDVYRKGGRFAASVEPKVIQLDQNRVNLVFEVTEGPKSSIGKINFMGNKIYNNDDLRAVIRSRESRWWRFLTSDDTYDADRTAYDKQLLRDFYRSQGYADFRITSAVTELAPNKEDFFINMTVEEGELYHFGEIKVESQIPDLKSEVLQLLVFTRKGKLYNSELIDQTVEYLTDVAGLKGYAFVNVRPRISRDRENKAVNITYIVNKAPRVYVERVQINGNVRTHDRVIRREMRLIEGDSYNSSKMKRSEIRIKGLGFFKEVEINQVEGSTNDKTILEVTVEEQATGELSVGAGYSSQENLLFDFSIRERNLLGRGQDLRLGTRISGRRKEVDIGFTEPYLMGRQVVAGVDVYFRDNSFREANYEEVSLGMGLRTAFPLTEYIVMSSRYNLRRDKIDIPTSLLGATRSPFVTTNIGTFVTSSVGYGISYNTLDNRQKPNRGQNIVFNQDFAGIGGNVKYLRSQATYNYFVPVYGRWIFGVKAEGGHIMGLGRDVRINDRFFLGNPRIRGFEQAGIGPRDDVTRDALGGNVFYKGTLELYIPLGSGARELGIEASAFVDAGALFNVDLPNTLVNTTGLTHTVVGDTMTPRVSAGVGFTWMSPFGPFRVDFAKAIMSNEFDKTEFFQFNIGTRF
ncbi:outer membrane protein assembly factor BamA [Paremcibacter congregatus]|uniref:Outer membrane protein assembly factor BamA n=1 Tax=Paremcibacter congregatus TaxID=2043170 RepID=A0A2G4YV76_9PROT|nr:outer membrane protein assembly factor BamA [Paremcibacter congregatus]QDE27723.1 outer membrane protein assembly factor BamA [Paremcibacter congregatus]